MVIRKMNSVFSRHGRVIFGVITVIIVISFMGFMQPGSGFSGFFSIFTDKDSYGEIFEQKVSRDDVVEKANRNLIINDIKYNIGLNSYMGSSQAESNAYINLCFLAVAKRRGIDASNKEITDFIINSPKFRNPETQKYDNKLFSNYIENDLKANGFNAKDLDKAVREDLIQNKLLDELRESVVVTDDEVEKFYKLMNEKYYASYAVFNKKAYMKDIKVTPQEAEDYFGGYTPELADYIPGKSKVLLVKFDYSNPEFDEEVKKGLTEEAVKEFYEDNKNLFMKFTKGQKPKPQPFSEVKVKAEKMLGQSLRKKLASTKAEKFAEAAYDAVGETVEKKQRKVFEELLDQFNYKAISTDWFRDDAIEVAKLNEPGLIREISILREVPVSSAVAGNQAAYVAFVTDRIESRPAIFEEIKDKIIAKLKDQKAVKMARAQAREMVAKLQKMDKAQRLKAVNDSKQPKFEILAPFSLKESPRIQYGGVVLNSVRELRNGELAPAQNIPDGAVVVVLRKRILPSMSKFDEKEKENLTSMYKGQKISVSQASFMTWLQTKCKQTERP